MLHVALVIFLCQAPVDAAPADGLSAAQILQRAEARQGGGELAKSIKDFEAHLIATFRDDKGNENETKVIRRFAIDGHIWTRIQESFSKADYEEGYDPEKEQYWHYDVKKDEVVDLTTKADYKADRKKIDDDIERMRLLVKVFLIQNLASQLTDLTRLADADDGKWQAYVIEGKGKIEEHAKDPVPAAIRLWFLKKNLAGGDGPGEYDLVGARIAREDGSKPDQLCFRNHSVTPQKIVMPGRVEMYHGDEKKPYLTLGFSEEEGKWIKFNNGFGPADFRPKK